MWETRKKRKASGHLMSLRCWIQVLFQRVKLQGMGDKEGEEVWKMVLNKEARSCKVLLRKMLTFLQVKFLKELQSQAPRKWGHTPKNQHLSTQVRLSTSGAERKVSARLSILILLHLRKDAGIAERSRYCCACTAAPTWPPLYPLEWGCSVQLCPDSQKLFQHSHLCVLLLPCHGQRDEFQCRLEAFPGLPWLFL